MTETVLSVGIDIGTSTTQLVFSALEIENTAGVTSVPRISVVDKRIVYRSDIHFTPLLSYELQQKNWARELTRGWGYEYAMRFESQSLTLQEMEHTIYKNWKKCIDTAIMYRLRDDDHTIMATFWLTAYPGSKIDMGM